MLNRGIVKMRDGKECSTGKAWGCSIAEDQNCADYENCGVQFIKRIHHVLELLDVVRRARERVQPDRWWQPRRLSQAIEQCVLRVHAAQPARARRPAGHRHG